MTRTLAAVALLVFSAAAWAAEIKLEARPNDLVWVRGQDEPYEGAIKEEDENVVRFVTLKGIAYTFRHDQVTRIQRKCTLVEAYEQASAAAGNNPAVRMTLYQACLEANLKAQAVAELKKAVLFDPRFLPAYEKLLEEARSSRNLDLELGTLEAAARSGAATVQMLGRQAEIYARLGLYDNAEEPLRKILLLDPADARAESKLAMVELLRGQVDRAETRVQAMLRRDNTSADALVALGQVELARGRPKEAADAFARALEQSKSAVAAASLGAIRLNQSVKNLDEAQQNYDLALALQPGLTSAMVGRALIAARRGNQEEAQKLLDGVTDRSDPPVMLARGYAAEFARKDSEALAAYEAALETDRANVYALTGAARVSWRMGERQKALEYIQQALAVQPSFAPAVRTMGHLKLEQDPSEAAAWFRRLIDSRSATLEDRLAHAGALIRLQRFGEAAAELEKAGPENVHSRIGLGFICYAQGKIDDGVGHFEAAVRMGDYRNYAANALRQIKLAESRVEWKDDFQRPDNPEVLNEWQESEPAGVSVSIFGNTLLVDGQPVGGNAMVRVSRQEGAGFVSVSADAATGSEAESFAGVFIVVRGKPSQTGVYFGRSGNGQAALFTDPQQPSPKELGRRIPEGRFSVGLEMVDETKGIVRLLIDGQRVPGSRDVQVPELAGAAAFDVGIFALPPAGRKVNCRFHVVRIVRSK